MKTMEALIDEVPALAGLAPSFLELVAGCATNARFEAGDYIFREGDAANNFYAIRRGSAALEIHVPAREAVIIETLHEGDLLGWSWLFPPYRWSFDAHAVEPVGAIAFDGACLRRKCEDDHDLGYELMRRISQVIIERLQATRLRLLDVYGVGAAT
jgi:CRP/FNR family transcriptional regulator, cyclic AMP receptor protein